MSFQTYWLVVPVVGLILNGIGIAFLLLTRNRTAQPAEGERHRRRGARQATRGRGVSVSAMHRVDIAHAQRGLTASSRPSFIKPVRGGHRSYMAIGVQP